MSYRTASERTSEAARARVCTYADTVANLAKMNPATRAGCWLVQRHAIAPALADAVAQLTGLAIADAR